MRRTLPEACRNAENSAAGRTLRSGRWPKGAGHWALAAVVGVVVSLALAPAALAASGSIEGTVTESAHNGVAKVSVTVYSEAEEVKGSSTTNAKGEYAVAGLPGGEYKVGFSDQPEYANQYYKKQSSFENANFVSVVEGSPTTGIDAEMLQPGKITGRVTNTTGAPVEDVNVEVNGGEFEFIAGTSAVTNANGEYTIENLPEGVYRVSFSPRGSTYLPQYYNGQGSFASANPVLVSAGKTTPGINAVLVEGGKISGTVTDAYTHAGVGKIEVFAIESGGEFGGGVAVTNANGEYTITGLRSGSYKVGFSWLYSSAEIKACEHLPRCPPKYVTQYFSNQLSEATANPVRAAVAAITPGVNAAMVPSLPYNTAGPGVSGTPTVGSLLTCSSGSWTGEPELALAVGWPLTSPFSYQWLREGAPIAGATSPAYTVQAADVGHSLVCEVTATNVAGRTSARSAALSVLLPVVTLSSSKISVSGGSARVPLACANATCAGTIELTAQVKGKGKKAKKRTVIVAKGSYSLAAGKKATISVRLTAAGKSALASAKGHRLSGKGTVTVTSGTAVKKSVVVSEPTKSKRR
jgi:hypothetical protein